MIVISRWASARRQLCFQKKRNIIFILVILAFQFERTLVVFKNSEHLPSLREKEAFIRDIPSNDSCISRPKTEEQPYQGSGKWSEAYRLLQCSQNMEATTRAAWDFCLRVPPQGAWQLWYRAHNLLFPGHLGKQPGPDTPCRMMEGPGKEEKQRRGSPNSVWQLCPLLVMIPALRAAGVSQSCQIHLFTLVTTG